MPVKRIRAAIIVAAAIDAIIIGLIVLAVC
jgi:hypothetical protein